MHIRSNAHYNSIQDKSNKTVLQLHRYRILKGINISLIKKSLKIADRACTPDFYRKHVP